MKALSLLLLTSFLLHNAIAEEAQSSMYKVHASGRVRYEAVDNKDFSSQADDKNNFIGNRFRLGLEFDPKPQTKLYLQLQYSSVWGSPSGTLSDNPQTVHQAYIQRMLANNLKVKVGRQEIKYGDELLVGAVGWSNTGRSFDALKMSWDHSLGWSDIFIADVAKTTGTVTTNGHYFSGLYNHLSFSYLDELDLYVFHTEDPNGVTSEGAVHYGSRVKSKLENFDYRFEATGQGEVDGHQMDLEVGFIFSEEMKSRVAIEAFTASKDYIQLFPTGHKWLGVGDFLSRRNISGLRTGISSNLVEKLSGRLDYHLFQRTDANLPAYNFSGGALGSLGDNKDIGSEVDVELTYLVDEDFNLSLGGAHFSRGNYLKDNGGTSEGEFVYFQMSLDI